MNTHPRNHRESFDRKISSIREALYFLNKPQRTALLHKADVPLLRAVCECALNILCGNVPLDSNQTRKSRSYADLMRKIASKNITYRKKKQLIVQKGGGAFLSLLLAPILSTLLSRVIRD